MKGYIRTLLRESLLNESLTNPFKNITNINDYDKLMQGLYDELPSSYNDIVGNVEYMSPKEYLEYCAYLQDTTYDEQLSIVNSVYGSIKVSNLVELINRGVKLDMPYLNLVNGQVAQEGRHRVKAAMDLGIKEVPIFVITSRSGNNKKNTSGNLVSDKLGEWDDLVSVDNNLYVKFKLSDVKEVIMLERCIIDNDTCLIDDIISSKINKKSFIDIANTSGGKYVDREDVIEFIDRFPDDYKKLLEYNEDDEDLWEKRLDMMIPSLNLLAKLFIMEHNNNIINNIFDVNNGDGYLEVNEELNLKYDYKSGKDMLLNMQIYKDEYNFYSINDKDYYYMDYRFIEKYSYLLIRYQTVKNLRH